MVKITDEIVRAKIVLDTGDGASSGNAGQTSPASSEGKKQHRETTHLLRNIGGTMGRIGVALGVGAAVLGVGRVLEEKGVLKSKKERREQSDRLIESTTGDSWMPDWMKDFFDEKALDRLSDQLQEAEKDGKITNDEMKSLKDTMEDISKVGIRNNDNLKYFDELTAKILGTVKAQERLQRVSGKQRIYNGTGQQVGTYDWENNLASQTSYLDLANTAISEQQVKTDTSSKQIMSKQVLFTDLANQKV